MPRITKVYEDDVSLSNVLDVLRRPVLVSNWNLPSELPLKIEYVMTPVRIQQMSGNRFRTFSRINS